MDRRAFIWVAAGGLLTAPLAAEAQQAGRVRRIGWLDLHDPADDFQAPFVRELRELGYIEGRNLMLDVRNGGSEVPRLPALAADLVRLKVDLIVALNDLAIRAASEATKTIPIVMLESSDPIGLGFVASLGRPGGNVTGLTTAGPELTEKQLDLLKEMVPRLARVTVLTDATLGARERAQQRTRRAAQALGIVLAFEAVRSRTDVEHAFSGMVGSPPDALLILGEGQRDRPSTNRIAQLARTLKIPVMSGSILMTFEGGLMSYGVSYAPQARRAAGYADKILRGAKPADLPVEQPTEFQFVINGQTAKAIGLTIPQSLLAQADQVIE